MINQNYFNFISYKLLILYFLIQYFIKITYQMPIYQNTLYTGDATVYGGSIYGGSCGFKNIWSSNTQNLFNRGLAINSKQYNNSLSCGRCINIQYTNKNKSISSQTAIVTDICPECKFGDLDLFTETYNTLINEEPGRKLISWNFINCPENIVSNNVQLRIDEINYYWLSNQPEKFKCGITNLFIYQNNEWIGMNRNDSKMMGLFFIFNNKISIPFKFKIINIFSEEIITDNYFELKNLFILNNQFLCHENYKSTNHKNEIILNYQSDITCD